MVISNMFNLTIAFVCVHACKVQRSPLGVILQIPSTSFFNCLSIGLEPDNYARLSQVSSCLYLPSTVITGVNPRPGFLCGCWGLELGLHACMTSTLLTDPAPQLHFFYFSIRKK